ncbi:MAG: MFS transporter [Clostridia bacterium]|nr:MFS transporter [Clostridia bacterium]
MKPRKKLEYKWVIVGLCFLMILTTLGFCSSNKALYLSAITEALQIPRAAFSLGDSIRFITTAVVNMLFGTLVRKFGTKKMIGAGFCSLICFTVLQATSTSVWGFYLGSVFLGMGLSWTTTTMVGWVVGRWCKENKGTIMGAVLAANGIGGAVAAQIITPIIYNPNNAFGYRNAYWMVACILFCVGTLIMIFYKEKPKEAGDHIPHAKKKNRGQSWTGLDFTEVKRKPYFYSALVCIFFTGAILQGTSGISAAHFKDVGLDTAFIATILSVHSLLLTGSKFITGFFYDKLGLRFTMTLCYIASFVSMLSLYFSGPSKTGTWAIAIGYSFICLALPLETIMLPIFAGDLFGERSYDHTLGLFVSVNTAGYAVGAPVANWVFDHFGTYTPLFPVCAVLMVVICIITQFNVSAAHKYRKIVAEQAELESAK